MEASEKCPVWIRHITNYLWATIFYLLVKIKTHSPVSCLESWIIYVKLVGLTVLQILETVSTSSLPLSHLWNVLLLYRVCTESTTFGLTWEMILKLPVIKSWLFLVLLWTPNQWSSKHIPLQFLYFRISITSTI